MDMLYIRARGALVSVESHAQPNGPSCALVHLQIGIFLTSSFARASKTGINGCTDRCSVFTSHC